MSGIYLGFEIVIGILVAFVALGMGRNFYCLHISSKPLPADIANRVVLTTARNTLKHLPKMSPAKRREAFDTAALLLTGSVPNLYPSTLCEVIYTMKEIAKYDKVNSDGVGEKTFDKEEV